MPQFRRDCVSGRWVIIATERQARPRDFRVPRGRRDGGFCPFCEGNEDRTPPELYAVRGREGRPNGPGWRVRVVPNKYPALEPDGDLTRGGDPCHEVVAGKGAHEVIIESPRHVLSPTEMPPEEFELVLRAYCDRMRALWSEPWVTYVLIFKNVGEAGGASIEHAHSQLIALPVMPKRVQEELDNCQAFYASRGRCLFCEMIESELLAGERVVLQSDQFLVLSPFASRFPFEMCILPRGHACHFCLMDRGQVAELAGVLREAIGRMESCLEAPPYNYLIHTAPVPDGAERYYHWHIELMPRVTGVAGFEWGTGFYINPMAPEVATECLRQASSCCLGQAPSAAAVRPER